jgi:3-deoxy-manno-octulosonate cytidylyltransferase (CMP-KDO synthetase)
MKIIGVIPARYNSTRMPGKLLMNLCGHPMIWWVYQNVKKVKEFSDICIATDDNRIKNMCENFGAKVLMTSSNCSCLIDRLYQVSEIINADYYVSINGDEPILEAEVIPKVIPDFIETTKPVVRGLVKNFTNPVEVQDSGNIKIVIGLGGYSLYSSRSPIPYPHKSTQFFYKKYVGVELFNKLALDFYVNTEPTEIEKIEDIGSIRFLEYGYRIHYDLVNSDSLSVDTEKDLEKVISILERNRIL